MRNLLLVVAISLLASGCGESDDDDLQIVEEVRTINRESGFNIEQLGDSPVSILSDPDFQGELQGNPVSMESPFSEEEVLGVNYIDDRGTEIIAFSNSSNGSKPAIYSKVKMIGVPMPLDVLPLDLISIVYPARYDGLKSIVLKSNKEIWSIFHYTYGIDSVDDLPYQKFDNNDKIMFHIPENNLEINFNYQLVP